MPRVLGMLRASPLGTVRHKKVLSSHTPLLAGPPGAVGPHCLPLCFTSVAAPSTHQTVQSQQHSLHLPPVSSKDLNPSPCTPLSA